MLYSRYRWRVRLPLSIVVSAVLLLPSFGSVLAENSSTDYFIPLETLYNTCPPGDVVVGSGSVRQHIDLVTTSSGNSIFSIHTDEFFTGVGASGNSYVSSQTFYDQYSNTGSTDRFDEVDVYPLISQGPFPNFFLHTVTHFQFVNGALTVDKFDLFTDCNG